MKPNEDAMERPCQKPAHVFSVVIGKTGGRLVDGLRRLGLPISASDDSERLEFDEVTGSLYLAYLANHLGNLHHTPVITNDEKFQPLIRTIQLNDNASDPGQGYYDMMNADRKKENE